MAHWGWYWKIKMEHDPKDLCEFMRFHEIDSFSMFKPYDKARLVMQSSDRRSLDIPRYKLQAYLQDDDSLLVVTDDKRYVIPVEKMPCNYGGSYFFFHCPLCDKRMRKLYCVDGQYQCRKCGKLGYVSQRLRPKLRLRHRQQKLEEKIKNRGGDLCKKIRPARMHRKTFQKLKDADKYIEAKIDLANYQELREWYGERVEPFLDDFEWQSQDIVSDYERQYLSK